jgi:hypothetical protein
MERVLKFLLTKIKSRAEVANSNLVTLNFHSFKIKNKIFFKFDLLI